MDEQEELQQLESQIDVRRIIEKADGWEDEWSRLLTCLWGDGLSGILPRRALRCLRFWNRKKAFYNSEGTRINRNFDELSQDFLADLWQWYALNRREVDWQSRYLDKNPYCLTFVQYLVSSNYLSILARNFCNRRLAQEISHNKRFLSLSGLENVDADLSATQPGTVSTNCSEDWRRERLLPRLADHLIDSSGAFTQPELYSGMELLSPLEEYRQTLLYADDTSADQADLRLSALEALTSKTESWVESKRPDWVKPGRDRIHEAEKAALDELAAQIDRLHDLRYRRCQSNLTQAYQNYTARILTLQFATLFIPIQGDRLKTLLNLTVANTVQQHISRYKAFLKKLLIETPES